MLRATCAAVGLTLAVIVLPALSADPAATPAAIEWVADDAVLVLEVTKPTEVLDFALNPKLSAAVTAVPAYQQVAAQPGYQQFLGFLKYIEGRVGTDWQSALRKLVGGGVTLAVRPDGSSMMAVDCEDPRLLTELHDIMLFVARGEAAKKGEADQIRSADYRGVTGWTLGGKEAHAIVGKRLLVASGGDALKAVIDRSAEPSGKSIADVPAYQAAKKAAGAAAARLFVNTGVLKQVPDIEKALRERTNPIGALLLADIPDALQASTWLAVGLDAKDATLKLHATTDGAAGASPVAFAAAEKGEQGTLENLTVPRRIAAASFYRDLHGFYSAKDELFPERTSGLIFFENMMGIFFTGRDWTEEVLAETANDVRLVVAEQKYDAAAGTPGMQIPAFAAILRLRNPAKFGPVVEEAWQKAIGLVNFTRGQDAKPGLIIDRPTHGGVKFTVASFAASGIEDKANADARFNFSPTLAMPGEYLVLSSTEGLARDLIDSVQQGAGKRLAPAHTLVELNGQQLSSILNANRENFIRQNMVEKGHGREQAEGEIGILLTIADRVAQSTLEVGQQDGRPDATLALTLDLN